MTRGQTVFQVHVRNTLLEVGQGWHHFIPRKEVISSIEGVLRGGASLEELIQVLLSVARRGRIIEVLHHHLQPQCVGSLRELLQAGIDLLVGILRSVSRTEARNHQHPVVSVLLHERQGLVFQLLLLPFIVVHPGDGTGMLETQFVQNLQFIFTQRDGYIQSLVAQASDFLSSFPKGNAFLLGYTLYMVTEQRNFRLCTQGQAKHHKDKR